MNSRIELYRPALRRKDFSAVLHCLVHDLSVPEQPQKKFIQKLCNISKMRSAWSYRDMERAIRQAFFLAGITAGSRVGLSPFVHPLYVDLLLAQGAIPVLVDTDVTVPVISSLREDAGLSAIIVDGPYGFQADIAALRTADMQIIEDGSYTLFAREGKALADMLILSHEAEALVTTGGGATLLSACRENYFSHPWQSLVDIHASLGLTQLGQLSQHCEHRRSIAESFAKACGDRVFSPLLSRRVHWGFLLCVESNREELFLIAEKMKVMVRPAFAHPLWEDDRLIVPDLPHARRLAALLIEIPLYPHLRISEQQRISQFLRALH